MRRLGYIFLVGSLGAALAGCGFTPMYGDGGNGGGAPVLREALADIEVAPIPDRLGQMVQNGLLDNMNPLGAPAAPEYRLHVSLETRIDGYGFRPDESVTRENFRLSANYRLQRLADGETILQDTVRSNLAYDIVQSDFANFSARQDAERRTVKQVVDTIVVRLGLHFRQDNSHMDDPARDRD